MFVPAWVCSSNIAPSSVAHGRHERLVNGGLAPCDVLVTRCIPLRSASISRQGRSNKLTRASCHVRYAYGMPWYSPRAGIQAFSSTTRFHAGRGPGPCIVLKAQQPKCRSATGLQSMPGAFTAPRECKPKQRGLVRPCVCARCTMHTSTLMCLVRSPKHKNATQRTVSPQSPLDQRQQWRTVTATYVGR